MPYEPLSKTPSPVLTHPHLEPLLNSFISSTLIIIDNSNPTCVKAIMEVCYEIILTRVPMYTRIYVYIVVEYL